MIARALTVVALLACLGCDTHPYVVPSPLPATMTLTVVVRDAGNQVVPTATAHINPSPVVAVDASGVVRFPIIYRDLPVTTLTVSAPGYRDVVQTVTVGPADQTVVVILRR